MVAILEPTEKESNMKSLLRLLKYAGVAVIVLEAVKTVVTKVADDYPELFETKPDKAPKAIENAE